MQSTLTGQAMPDTVPVPVLKRRRMFARWLPRLAAPLLVLLYFLPLGAVALEARWAADDMMNMYGYWNKGWGKLIVAQFEFWSTYYRPFAGLFYMPLYEMYGMDPLPYRIVIYIVLALNALLAYATARLLTRSYVVAALAAILTSFHTGEFVLYFNTSQLYDIFCFSFWFAAFYVYARTRLKGSTVGIGPLIAVFALYVCALNSKEMGVTFPVLLVAFELAWWRQLWPAHLPGSWKSPVTRQHLFRVALPIVITGLATLAYVIGKSTGPEALNNIGAYRPVITFGRFIDSNAHYAAELFYRKEFSIGRTNLLLVWAGMAYLAARFRRPYLWWGLAMVVFGNLPIAFIEGRGGGCLYISAFGYALHAAALVNAGLRWLSRESLFRWLRMTPVVARAVLLLVCIFLYARTQYRWTNATVPAWHESQNLTWNMIRQTERLAPTIKKGAKILFVDDPWVDWDTVFITALVLDDRTAQITLQRKLAQPPSPQERAAFDYVFIADKRAIHRLPN